MSDVPVTDVPDSMSYPLRAAVTRRFTLGAPRDVSVVRSGDGWSVLALRTDGPDDPVTHLWRFDPATGDAERLLDARTLGSDDADLPPEERARRERVREQAGGITAYTVDRAGMRVACALAGRLVVLELATRAARVLDLGIPVFDPRISPDGRLVALHHDDGVSIVKLDDDDPHPRSLIMEDGVVLGRAEFIAAEEMQRTRGMWWSPCSTRLAVTRVDEAQVHRAHLADLSRPERRPVELAYPFAGTPNAAVGLLLVDVASGARVDLDLAAAGPSDTEYLARVAWDVEPLLVGVQPRDQRALHVLALDPGGTVLRSVRRVVGDPWCELVPGSPAWLGGVLTVEDVRDADGVLRRALCREGLPVTPPGVEVRSIAAVHRSGDGSSGTVVITATLDDPTSVDVLAVRLGPDGAEQVRLSPAEPGLHHVVLGGVQDGEAEVRVRRTADLAADGPRTVMELRGPSGAWDARPLPSVAASPGLPLDVRMLELGPRRSRAALVLPSAGASPAQRLPVVLDPYAGPHAQRVLSARAAYHGAQWLADQGFAVLIVDGRGTPGRGPAFEHAVHGDLAGPALEDQLDALDEVGERFPVLDLGRVGVRGWSYGGTLAALLALRRPDRVRAAVVGAPVTDWALYDTHYTERYLGHPAEHPDAYARSAVVRADGSLVAPDASAAGAEPAELLVIHGLADDNVLAAHSLRLTEALHAAGHPFTFLPLTSATHMASDPAVAARLLEVQAAFLRRTLAA